jgi:hypothetical protein
MKVLVVIEKAKDGFFSCYMENETFDFALFGHGKTAAEAKSDLLLAYEEIKTMKLEKKEQIPDLVFDFKYDMQSFFDYFDFINVTKLAKSMDINPSLLRQYRTGATKASQKQYEKLERKVHSIWQELSAAMF